MFFSIVQLTFTRSKTKSLNVICIGAPPLCYDLYWLFNIQHFTKQLFIHIKNTLVNWSLSYSKEFLLVTFSVKIAYYSKGLKFSSSSYTKVTCKSNSIHTEKWFVNTTKYCYINKKICLIEWPQNSFVSIAKSLLLQEYCYINKSHVVILTKKLADCFVNATIYIVEKTIVLLLCKQNEVLILQCTFVALTIYFVYGTKISSDINKI